MLPECLDRQAGIIVVEVAYVLVVVDLKGDHPVLSKDELEPLLCAFAETRQCDRGGTL